MNPYAFPMNEGEDILLQSEVLYKNTNQGTPGTLSLTTQRVTFCKRSTASGDVATEEPLVSIGLGDIANHLVSTTKTVMLKLLTFEDEKQERAAAAAIEDAKKKGRKKKIFGSIFEFTSTGSAASERDGFRDLIAQLVPMHQRMKKQQQQQIIMRVKKEEKRENGEQEEEEDVQRTSAAPAEPKLLPIKAEKPYEDDMEIIPPPPPLLSELDSASLSTQRQNGTSRANKPPTVPKPAVTTPANAPPAKRRRLERGDSVGRLSVEEAKQRAALLAGNLELNSLFEKLVGSGVVTEEEFWETRKHMLQSEAHAATQQRKGMPSELLADVRPVMETCNAVHYRLTPTIIHQIFLEYPAVKKAYDEWVPDKLTEQQFWTKYFQSQYFHRDRVKASQARESTESGDVNADEVFASCSDNFTEDAELVRKKLKDVELSADLTVNQEELNTSALALEQPVGTGTEAGMSLIRRFNRHGALVLGSIATSNTVDDVSLLEKRDKGKEKIVGSDSEDDADEDAARRPPSSATTNGGVGAAGADAGAVAMDTATENGEHVASADGAGMRNAVQARRKQSGLTRQTLLEEMESAGNVEPILLNIQDHRRYFEGHSGETAPIGEVKANPEQLWEAWQGDLNGWLDGATGASSATTLAAMPLDDLVSKDTARVVLSDLARAQEKARANAAAARTLIAAAPLPSNPHSLVVSGGGFSVNSPNAMTTENSDQQPPLGVVVELSEEDKRRLYEYFTRANELLRHFWAAYPITTRALASKVSRVYNSISKLYDEIQLDKRETAARRPEFGKLLVGIAQALYAAIEWKDKGRTYL
eukprot:TRINITY_DN9235_c0_g2_i1.p1 TRINITY_DN9235_c0_g2~~TRINITY_DN9235_c0_g2_i1.p1  ORF type:complete len:816 (-),score=173.23 TRINITY_DN9235_c0_g2_i1:86-2533(-)